MKISKLSSSPTKHQPNGESTSPISLSPNSHKENMFFRQESRQTPSRPTSMAPLPPQVKRDKEKEGKEEFKQKHREILGHRERERETERNIFMSRDHPHQDLNILEDRDMHLEGRGCREKDKDPVKSPTSPVKQSIGKGSCLPTVIHPLVSELKKKHKNNIKSLDLGSRNDVIEELHNAFDLAERWSK